MMTCLNDVISYEKQSGSNRRAECLALLLSDNPDTKKVRAWLVTNARPGMRAVLPNISDSQDWEGELWFLSHLFCNFKPIDAWEAALSKERRAHSERVSNLARALADALEEEKRPYYHPVLNFFDPERAVDIIRAMPKGTTKALLSGSGYSAETRDGYERSGKPAYFENGKPRWANPSYTLASRFLFPVPQKFSTLLRRVADYAEEAAEEPKRDQRPSIPNANARAFARELAEHFKLFFNRTPNEVIASCVALKFPNIDPRPDESTIRQWRGVK